MLRSHSPTQKRANLLNNEIQKDYCNQVLRIFSLIGSGGISLLPGDLVVAAALVTAGCGKKNAPVSRGVRVKVIY
jgi:hypothetical protein